MKTNNLLLLSDVCCVCSKMERQIANQKIIMQNINKSGIWAADMIRTEGKNPGIFLTTDIPASCIRRGQTGKQTNVLVVLHIS